MFIVKYLNSFICHLRIQCNFKISGFDDVHPPFKEIPRLDH